MIPPSQEDLRQPTRCCRTQGAHHRKHSTRLDLPGKRYGPMVFLPFLYIYRKRRLLRTGRQSNGSSTIGGTRDSIEDKGCRITGLWTQCPQNSNSALSETLGMTPYMATWIPRSVIGIRSSDRQPRDPRVCNALLVKINQIWTFARLRLCRWTGGPPRRCSPAELCPRIVVCGKGCGLPTALTTKVQRHTKAEHSNRSAGRAKRNRNWRKKAHRK